MLYPFKQISKNKPLYTPYWKLGVTVEPVIQGNHCNVDFSNWELRVLFDEIVIFDQLVTNKITVSTDIEDTLDTEDHVLQISLLNAPATAPGQMLKIILTVEGLDINDVLIDKQIYYLANGDIKFGADLMGEVGTQKLAIQTPIYRWLFSHEDLIVKHLARS